MVTAALLTADTRLGFQIHSWMKEIAGTALLETHRDLREFIRVIETRPEAGDGQGKQDDGPLDVTDIGSGKTTKLGSERHYRILIVDLDFLTENGENPGQWIRDIRQKMSDCGRSDPIHPVRVMLMAFEAPSEVIEAYRHLDIDDLVLKPLDRSVFLQRIEFLAADKDNVKPSFLFRQEMKLSIEAGKDIVIDEMSEFSISIRNPTPLTEGVFAAIRCSVFGDGRDSRVVGRVSGSAIHPSHEGEWLVRFIFFGLTARQLENSRRFVRTNQIATRMPGGRGSPPPRAQSASSQGPRHRVAIIDMSPEINEEVKSTIESAFRSMSVMTFPSYRAFLKILEKAGRVAQSEQSSKASRGPVVPADEPAWPGGKTQTALISIENKVFTRFDPEPQKLVSVMGRTAKEWAERPSEFLAAVEPDDRDQLEDFFEYVATGARGRTLFRMRNAKGLCHFFEARGTLARDDNAVKMELRELEAAVYEAQASKSRGADAISPDDVRFDAIYIDGSLIRGPLEDWLAGLQESYAKAGIIRINEPLPKICILSEEGSAVVPDSFRLKKIHDFYHKPLDRKVLVNKTQILLPHLRRVQDPETSPYVPCEIPARLAKDVELSAIAEYGLSIHHPTPFKQKVFMRFFVPQLGEGADGILARCTHCEKASAQDPFFNCHFTFFGVGDELLKRIRTWIREDYVQKKEGKR